MNIVGIQGSPAAVSRSGGLLRLARERLRPAGGRYREIALRELPAQPLLHADADHPAIRAALDAVAGADLLLVATPIYQPAAELRERLDAALHGWLACHGGARPGNDSDLRPDRERDLSTRSARANDAVALVATA